MATNALTSSEPRVVSLGDGAASISDYRSWTFRFSRRRAFGRCLRFVVARLSSSCRLLRTYSILASQSLVNQTRSWNLILRFVSHFGRSCCCRYKFLEFLYVCVAIVSIVDSAYDVFAIFGAHSLDSCCRTKNPSRWLRNKVPKASIETIIIIAILFFIG
jgi:hypothetical protein